MPSLRNKIENDIYPTNRELGKPAGHSGEH